MASHKVLDVESAIPLVENGTTDTKTYANEGGDVEPLDFKVDAEDYDAESLTLSAAYYIFLRFIRHLLVDYFMILILIFLIQNGVVILVV